MFKILLIDRCHFTRAGFEAWLNHSGLFPGHYVVTGLNNLFLAREHILQWKPSLVIADLHGFRQDTPHFQQFSSLLNASEKLPFIMLQSREDRDMTAWLENFPVWSSLMKNARLEELATVINVGLRHAQTNSGHAVADPPGGESADNVDGRRKQSKNCRSPEYQWENGIYLQAKYPHEAAYGHALFPVFISAGYRKLTVRNPSGSVPLINYCCAFVAAPEIALPPSEIS